MNDMYGNYGAFGLGTDSHGRRVGADPRYNAQVMGREAGLGVNRAQADYGQAQGIQGDATDMYRQAAMGEGPTAAGAMHQQMADQNRARAVAMASGGRGGGIGSNRDAVVAGLAADNAAAQQAAQLRAQEQQAAMQGYAGLGMQQGAQALQQQQMMMGQQQGVLGMQFADDAHRRQMELEGKKYKTQRNLAWTNYGSNVAGSVLGGLA